MKRIFILILFSAVLLFGLENINTNGTYIDISNGGGNTKVEIPKETVEINKILKEINFISLKLARKVTNYNCEGINNDICPYDKVSCTATYEVPYCGSGKLNPFTHMCEANTIKKICPDGWKYEKDIDTCVKAPVCPGGGRYNPNTKRCELSNSYACNVPVYAAASGYDFQVKDRYIKIGNDSLKLTRGWCVAVLSRNWAKEDVKCFDTHGSLKEANNFADYLNSIKKGKYVVIVTWDEPRNNVYNNEKLITALRKVGATESIIRNLEYRSAYALIGIKENTVGATIAEKYSPRFGKPVYITNFSAGYHQAKDKNNNTICVKSINCGVGVFNEAKNRCELTPTYSCIGGNKNYSYSHNLSKNTEKYYCDNNKGYYLNKDKTLCIKNKDKITVENACTKLIMKDTAKTPVEIDFKNGICKYQTAIGKCPFGYKVTKINGVEKCIARAQCNAGSTIQTTNQVDKCSDGSLSFCRYGNAYINHNNYQDYCIGNLLPTRERCDYLAGYSFKNINNVDYCVKNIECLDTQFANYNKTTKQCEKKPASSTNNGLCIMQDTLSVKDGCGNPSNSRKLNLIATENKCLYYADLGAMNCDKSNGYYPFISSNDIGYCIKMNNSTTIKSNYPKKLNPSDNCPPFSHNNIVIKGGNIDKCIADKVIKCPYGYRPGAVDGNTQQCEKQVNSLDNCPARTVYNPALNKCQGTEYSSNLIVEGDDCWSSKVGCASTAFAWNVPSSYPLKNLIQKHKKIYVYEGGRYKGSLTSYNQVTAIHNECDGFGIKTKNGWKAGCFSGKCNRGTGFSFCWKKSCQVAKIITSGGVGCGYGKNACVSYYCKNTNNISCPSGYSKIFINGKATCAKTYFKNPSCNGTAFGNVNNTKDKCYTSVSYMPSPSNKWTLDPNTHKYYANIICSKNSDASYIKDWDSCRYNVGKNYHCDTSLGYRPTLINGKQACLKIPSCPSQGNGKNVYWSKKNHKCISAAKVLCPGGIGLNPKTGLVESCNASQKWCHLYEYDAKDEKCIVKNISCGTNFYDSNNSTCYYYAHETSCRTDLGYTLYQPDLKDQSQDECYIQDIKKLTNICKNADNFKIDTSYDKKLSAHKDNNSTIIKKNIIFSRLYNGCSTGWDSKLNRGILGHVCPNPISFGYVWKFNKYFNIDGSIPKNGITDKCMMVPICKTGIFNPATNGCYLGNFTCPLGPQYKCRKMSNTPVPNPKNPNSFLEDMWCSPVNCHNQKCKVATCQYQSNQNPQHPNWCYGKICDGFEPYTQCGKIKCPSNAVTKIINGHVHCYLKACPDKKGVFIYNNNCYMEKCPSNSVQENNKCYKYE